MDTKLALNALPIFGAGMAFRILRNTLYRDLNNQAFKPSQEAARNPGLIVHTRLVPSGAHFEFEHAEMEIIFLAPDLTRITWQQRGAPLPLPVPYALAKTDWNPVTDRWQVDLEEMTFSTRAMNVIVQNDGGVLFRDLDGKTIRDELPPSFNGNAVSQRTLLEPDTRIYGLGEKTSRLNHRIPNFEHLPPGSSSYRMWNRDPGGAYSAYDDPIYINIPVYIGLHSKGSYLVFYENSYPATFSFEATAETHFEFGPLRYYVITGSLEHIIERYSELTGRPPLPPRWVLGYHQCRWGYKTEADIRQVIAGFEAHNLPISAIHLDIDYMNGYRVFTTNLERFPNLKSLTSDLASKGIKTVAILDPGVKKDSKFDIFREGNQNGYFIKMPNGKTLFGLAWPGWSAFPDFTDPNVRQWWGSLYLRLLDHGVAGFWHDMNEPASFAAWGDPTLPLNSQHEFDGRKGQHIEAHNLYGLLMARSGYEALKDLHPNQRPWIFTRAGWAGMQRYAWSWTGDTATSWTTLRMTVPEILNLSLSGVPFTGPDIGGFSAHPSAELYTRWFQLAAFLPFFRTHSSLGTPPREPWAYGEPTTTILRNFLQLRYRLLPFLYTQVWDTSHTGHPFIRPLVWLDSSDRRLWDIDDTFMIGNALLVAPILEEGITSRSITLPKGDWYDFWQDSGEGTGSKVSSGPGKLDVAISIERIPIFVRAGTILPTEENGKLVLHLYPIRDTSTTVAGRGSLYSDAGDGFGVSRVDHFHLDQTADGFEFSHFSDGDYPFDLNGIIIQLHGYTLEKVQANGMDIEVKQNRAELSSFRKALLKIS